MAAHANGVTQPQEVYEGVSITEFRRNTRTIYVEWFDKKLRVEYMPGQLDDEWDAELDTIRDDPSKPHSEWLRSYMLHAVHSIPSLRMDNGDPFMMTAETEPMLAVPLKNRIVSAISEDMRPKATSENGSSGTSSPAAGAA